MLMFLLHFVICFKLHERQHKDQINQMREFTNTLSKRIHDKKQIVYQKIKESLLSL